MNEEQLQRTSLSALAIVGGVVVKNTVKNLIANGKLPKKGTHFWVSTLVGIVLFVGGWVGMGWATVEATNGVNEPWIWVGIAGVVSAVLLQQAPDLFGFKAPTMLMATLFIGGWSIFGYSAAGNDQNKLWLTLPAAGLVISSMALGILAWQRANCVIDGPGFPMFMVAWGLLILSNSLELN